MRDIRGTIAWILLAVCALVLVAIANRPTGTDAGIVIDKRPTLAYSELAIIRDMGVVETLHPAGWAIKVQDVDHKSLTEWWSVSESMYHLINVGDYVFREGGAICVEGVEE